MRIKALMMALTGVACFSSPSAAQRAGLDVRMLAPQADTFAFYFDDKIVGRQVISLTADSGGYLFREMTTMPNGEQTTEVRLDGSGSMRSTHQDGQIRGQSMRIDVVYVGGRATGRASAPQPTGIVEVDVDAEVPLDVVDDNVFPALLQALPWTASARFEIPVFSSGKNKVAIRTLRVTGVEDVVIPAGHASAYRVEVDGEQPLVVHVAVSAPHRLLRLAVVGAPFELVCTGPPVK